MNKKEYKNPSVSVRATRLRAGLLAGSGVEAGAKTFFSEGLDAGEKLAGSENGGSSVGGQNSLLAW